MAKDIKFNLKIFVEGNAQVVEAVTSTKDLQGAVAGAKNSTMNTESGHFSA